MIITRVMTKLRKNICHCGYSCKKNLSSLKYCNIEIRRSEFFCFFVLNWFFNLRRPVSTKKFYNTGKVLLGAKPNLPKQITCSCL